MKHETYDILSLNQGDIVTVIIRSNTQKIEFTSTVIDKDDEYTYIKPVLIKGKILNLSSPRVTIDVLWKRTEGSPVIWRNCQINIVRPEHMSSRYVILPSEDGFEYNRRRHYRLPVRLHGESKIEGYAKVREMKVRDLSISGCSIEIDEDLETYENAPLHLTFNDDNLNYHFDLHATILRKDNKSNNRFCYGCRFDQPYMQIGHYINLKQQAEVLSNPETSTPSKMKYFEMIKSVRKCIR